MTSNKLFIVAAVTIVSLQAGVILGTAWARPHHSVGRHAVSEPMQMIKSIPEGATLELHVNGQVAQSMNIRPGTYKIIIQELR